MEPGLRQRETARAARGYHPLVLVAGSVATGIAADRYSSIPHGAWLVASAACLVAWLPIFLCGMSRTASAALLLASAAIGGLWGHDRWNLFGAEDIGLFAEAEGTPTCIEATVVGQVRRFPAPAHDPLRAIPHTDESRIELTVLRIRDADQWRPASGRVTARVEGHVLGLSHGDLVRVVGQLVRPAAPGNPGQFDRGAWLRSQGQHAAVFADNPACVERLSGGRPVSPRRLLGRIRQTSSGLLREHLGHEQHPLAAAILLGEREHLTYRRRQPYLETGAVHFLVISGLHVGLLAAMLLAPARMGLLPWRTASWMAIATVVLYVGLVDARPPVVRAAVLVIAFCVAMSQGRRTAGFNALAAAALVVLAINPADLLNVGAQLSFLAVATLMWVGPRLLPPEPDPLERLIRETRPWPQRLAAAATGRVYWLFLAGLAVWLVAWPLVSHRFHLFSPVAAALHVLLLPVVAVALYAGFALILAGWLLPWLVEPAAGLCDGSLRLMGSLVEHAHALPVSYRWTPGPALWWVAATYLGLAVLAAAPGLRPSRRWMAAILTAWVATPSAIAMLRSPGRPSEPPLRCAFLDVGHGAAVVIETPTGQVVVYDVGSLRSPAAAARAVAEYLWSRDKTRIEALVLSHADVDHYNGAAQLAERIRIERVYVSPVMFEDVAPDDDSSPAAAAQARGGSRALAALRRAIVNAEIPLEEISAGDRLRLPGKVTIEVLHPPRKGVGITDNANSLVLSVEYAGRRVLLPGDLEPPGLEDVMAELPLDCDVVMAPHHGSPRSNPRGFAAWCAPEHVVISGGHEPSLPHVVAELRAAGCNTLHTARVGAVIFSLHRDRVTYATGR